jgi:hypothetical protein
MSELHGKSLERFVLCAPLWLCAFVVEALIPGPANGADFHHKEHKAHKEHTKRTFSNHTEDREARGQKRYIEKYQ